MIIEFINLKAQYKKLKEDINLKIQKVLDHGQYIMGPEVNELEGRLSNFTNAKHCITVASGTEALLISLMAINIKPGDEVITTPFSFISAAEAIVLLGAIPVFVDVELDTCNIDVSLIERKINEKTKAIIPVSIFGQPPDMDEINALAEKNNLVVIEDAAQSFGATYKGKKSCNLSKIGCTSFFPSKPLGCYGDGGAIFTNDDSLAKVIREIRVHGQSKRYIHTRVGVGGRMDTLQCAILLAKLDWFDWEVEQRIRLGSQYNKFFKSKLKTVVQRPDRTSVFAQYTVFLDNRDKIQEKLSGFNIPVSIHYPMPIHKQTPYSIFFLDKEELWNSVKLSQTVLSIPFSPYLTDEEQLEVISKLLCNC